MQCILDFGAGSLFWTKKFAEISPNSTVYAVDTFYSGNEAMLPRIPNVLYRSDVLRLLSETDFGLTWICDVLHHLTSDFEQTVLKAITAKSNVIIIKDIDCNHAFGNFCNRAHDRLINGERVRDIDPKQITALLENSGFTVEYRYIPKLWYPHFVLIARRNT
jgi:hypothetical protein